MEILSACHVEIGRTETLQSVNGTKNEILTQTTWDKRRNE